jgi:glycosyltransferase involved in cell wall biosynthesis
MNKIIEYMAFGRPIVAFDLIEHRRSAESAAIYVKGNDDVAMARAIRELLLDVERRLVMSKFARARFRERLAWENSEKRLIAIYQHLLYDQIPLSLAARTDGNAGLSLDQSRPLPKSSESGRHPDLYY